MPATPTFPAFFDPSKECQWSPLGHARGATAITASTTVTATQAVMISLTASTGTVNLTLTDGSQIVVNPALGDNIYPFGVISWSAGSATPSSVYSLY
jgi:hypothetical protein